MSGNLHVFDTPEVLARGLADAFVEHAGRAISARGSFNVALAGGTTPKAAYALLAQSPRRDGVQWDRVQVFFGDERCVPPDDADSNYRMACETFLNAVPVPKANIHRMRGEDDPPQAADDYASLLIALLGEQPRLDLIMLGMGPDGHTASLFPGTDPRTDEERLVRAVWVEKMKTHRITLTPAVINAAYAVIIATEGAGKAAMLRTVRDGAHNPVEYPVQIVDPAGGALEWYVDRAAASQPE
ncbi:MAG TPA: 6-phosphogluconolactonase [Candidatus Baltobacteraceae bacterium]|nr:6-phosphogluconolactonase [Candidatus Baltobacteraceae bacterium]